MLTLANGYLSASEIKTTDNTTKKTSKFLPATGTVDAEKKMTFDHNSSSNKKFTDYFILDGIEENHEKVPSQIMGKYYFNGTAFNITFTKNKAGTNIK